MAATLYLTVVAWCVGVDELVPDIHLSGGDLKQGGHIPLAVGAALVSVHCH